MAICCRVVVSCISVDKVYLHAIMKEARGKMCYSVLWNARLGFPVWIVLCKWRKSIFLCSVITESRVSNVSSAKRRTVHDFLSKNSDDNM